MGDSSGTDTKQEEPEAGGVDDDPVVKPNGTTSEELATPTADGAGPEALGGAFPPGIARGPASATVSFPPQKIARFSISQKTSFLQMKKLF